MEKGACVTVDCKASAAPRPLGDGAGRGTPGGAGQRCAATPPPLMALHRLGHRARSVPAGALAPHHCPQRPRAVCSVVWRAGLRRREREEAARHKGGDGGTVGVSCQCSSPAR